MTNIKNIFLKEKTGRILFKFRSFTPLPLIILIFIFFKPVNLYSWNAFLNFMGAILIILGEFIRIISVGFSFPGTSGRENYLRADELNTSGIYSIVRNPLYIGNLIIYSGLLLIYSNFYALLLFDLLFVLQYYFIITYEEKFLQNKYGAEYKNYMSTVKRIIPKFSRVKSPVNKFNSKKVIFAENDSVFNAVFFFFILLIYKSVQFSKQAVFDDLFKFIPIVILIILYVLVKIVKKKSVSKQKSEES